MQKFTVVAYCDGERGCFAHWEHVEAPNLAMSWDAFKAKAADSLRGTISPQGVKIYDGDLQNLTEVVTFAGHVEPAL